MKDKVEMPMAPTETQLPQVQQAPAMPQMPQMAPMPMMGPAPMICCPLMMNMQCPFMHSQCMPGNNFMMGTPYASSPYMMNHNMCNPSMNNMMPY